MYQVRRSRAGQPRGPRGDPHDQQGDEGQDPQIEPHLGQVVRRKEHRLPEVAIAPEQIGHQRQQAVGCREASARGKAQSRSPPRCELAMASSPGSHWIAARDRASAAAAPPRVRTRHQRCAVEAGRECGIENDQDGQVEHRFGGPAEDHQGETHPSTTDQRHLPSLMMCSTARSIQGMATNPSVMSRWLTWLKRSPRR